MNELCSAMNRRGSSLRRSFDSASTSEHAFCDCYRGRPRETTCTCGESGKVIQWVWDVDTKSNCTHLVNDNKDVRFHLHFSGGTAVIRGNCPITHDQHYWEVKMTSLVYGTDMMVGIGTKDADIQKSSDKFCSVLGIDSETWGFSYTGLFHHEGTAREYASGFGQGSIIGVHLDMWNGNLSFYKNGQPLGIACGGLKGKTLYPMVSSTAARSGMRIIHSVSFPSSLQFFCCVALRNAISLDKSVLQSLSLPPGMRTFLANNLGWLLGEKELTSDKMPLPKSYPFTSGCCKKDPNSCSHQRLTCYDCNTPVFGCTSRPVETFVINEAASSSRRSHILVPSHSVLLEDRSGFISRQTSSQRESTSNGTSQQDHSSSSKGVKRSYDFAVGLIDAESDDFSD